MTTLLLKSENGHLFVALDGGFWLLDTGAPSSFGKSNHLHLAGESFTLPPDSLGFTPEMLSQYVGLECAGLLGGDVLCCFDHLFDVAHEKLTVSTPALDHCGTGLPMGDYSGIPIIAARIGECDHPMVFDTGAQLSYFQHDLLTNYPSAGRFYDFHPMIGAFETETHQVPMLLGGLAFSIRCGMLPHPLSVILTMAKVSGVVGHSILSDRVVGYFPRRHLLVL
jgi:hypothetical protein